MNYYQRIRAFLLSHMIFFGVSIAVIVALVLTSVSMWLYVVSDVARLDVSRPQYQSVREEVKKVEDTKKFNSTGPLDVQALRDFQELFDARRKSLNESGRFDGSLLNDDQLHLADPSVSGE